MEYQGLLDFVARVNAKGLQPVMYVTGNRGSVEELIRAMPSEVFDSKLDQDDYVSSGIAGIVRLPSGPIRLCVSAYEKRGAWIARGHNLEIIGAMDQDDQVYVSVPGPSAVSALVKDTPPPEVTPGRKRLPLIELCQLAGMPANARLVEVEYHSEPDGSLSLYAEDGDVNASITIEWDDGPTHDLPDDFLVEVGKLMAEHKIARISGGFIALHEKGYVTSAGVRWRIPGEPED